jgi:hypothetical protein
LYWCAAASLAPDVRHDDGERHEEQRPPLSYTTYRPRECPTEQGACIQRQQGGKDEQAISRTAALIVTSRLAGMLDRVSAIASSDQSHNQPILDSPLILPRTEIANTHRTHHMYHHT